MGNRRSRENSVDSDEGWFDGRGDAGELCEYTARDEPTLDEEDVEVC